MSPQGRKLAKVTASLVLLGSALDVAAPYGLALIMGSLASKDVEGLLLGLLVYGGIEAIGNVNGWFRMRVRERMIQDNFWHIPSQLTRRYFVRPLGMLTSEDSEIDGGGVESVKDKVWNIINLYLYTFVPNIGLATFAIGALWYVSGWVGLYALAYCLIDFWIGTKQNQYIHKRLVPVMDDFRRWERRVREWWNAILLIKKNGGEIRVVNQQKKEVMPILDEDDKIWRLFFPWAVLGRRVVGQVAAAILYAFSAYETLQGSIAVASFVLILFSFERIRTVLWEINDKQRDLGYMAGSVTKYREVLESPVPFRYDEGLEFHDAAIGVSFEQVSLTLGDAGEEREILQDVSFVVKPGERIGIVGPSGAGKSQLINLITRSMDPQKGIIRINQHDLRDLSLMSYLRFCGIIPQKSDLFEDSVRGNVVFGVSSLDWDQVERDPQLDAHVFEALRKAGLDLSDRLTKGLDTKVGHKGMRLSGGQQSRVRIADMHFKLAGHIADRPRLVIADEPTAALDSLSEMTVMQHLTDALPAGATMFMVAHRLSTVAGMDRIMFIKPVASLKPGEAQVVIYPSLRALYEAEALFREMADAQNFRP